MQKAGFLLRQIAPAVEGSPEPECITMNQHGLPRYGEILRDWNLLHLNPIADVEWKLVLEGFPFFGMMELQDFALPVE
jgi:hypothetical protein